MVVAFFSSTAQAQSSVSINFAITGLDNFNGNALTIDGTSYTKNWIPTFTWKPGTEHTITALTPLTGWDAVEHVFTSWTNGNGLTEATGIFTTPTTSTTVTANYGEVQTVSITFGFTGLETFWGDTLTIDGATYTRGNLPKTFTWEPGTEHAVTALTPLTAWDATYRFTGWTNGNGLTAITGTFTTPDTDTTVTANYIVSSEPLSTELTIQCSPTTVDKYGDATTTISGVLTSGSSTVIGEVELTCFDGAEWLAIATGTTTSAGTYSHAWNVPETIANGQYVLKAEFLGDSNYSGCSAVAEGDSSLFVVPEYAWGGLSVLFACFGAFLVIKVRRSGH